MNIVRKLKNLTKVALLGLLVCQATTTECGFWQTVKNNKGKIIFATVVTAAVGIGIYCFWRWKNQPAPVLQESASQEQVVPAEQALEHQEPGAQAGVSAEGAQGVFVDGTSVAGQTSGQADAGQVGEQAYPTEAKRKLDELRKAIAELERQNKEADAQADEISNEVDELGKAVEKTRADFLAVKEDLIGKKLVTIFMKDIL